MTVVVFLALALAGGLGAGTRYVVDGLIRSRLTTTYPWATTVINVSGSLVLGFVTGLTTAHLLPSDLSVIVGAGFLGGYTTFSTASYETVQLIKQNRYGWAVASAVGMLVACVAVAGLGLWLASRL